MRVLLAMIMLSTLIVPINIGMAQQQSGTGRDIVRPPRAATKPVDSYREGLRARAEGRCNDAIILLVPIARRGIGFEHAQHALGLCLMEEAGLQKLPYSEHRLIGKRRLTDSPGFQRGLDWVVQAANAGDFEAQASLIHLFNIGLGASNEPVEGAKWGHLYLTNPKRLGLGAPNTAHDAITHLQNSISHNDWLRGKERARIWTPSYHIAQPVKKSDTRSTIAR